MTATKKTSQPQIFLDKIYASLSFESKADLGQIIDNSIHKSYFGKGEYIVPMTLSSDQALRKLWPNAGEITFEYFNSNVAKAKGGAESFIVKEGSSFDRSKVIRELAGIDFLNSLKLHHLQIHKVVYAGDGYLIKTYLPGKTFAEFMSEIGSKPLADVERKQLFQELREGSYQAGKAIGELQNQSIKHAVRPEEFAINHAIDTFKERLESVRELLPMIDSSLMLPEFTQFKKIIEKFRLAPGPATFGFRDISPSQFTWCGTKKQFGCVDLEFVATTFNKAGRPLASVHEEYWEFMDLFNSKALSLHLTTKETAVLKSAFDAGYLSEYKGQLSSAADLFFRLSIELETMMNMAELVLENAVPLEQKKLVADLVKQFNETATAVTALKAKRPSLDDICSPEAIIVKTRKSEKLSSQGYYKNTVISVLSDRTTVAYIAGISNGTYTIKPQYTHDAAKGFLTQTLKRLKEKAMSQGSTRLIVEFEAKNEKLLQLAHKCYKYLGKSETTHLGIKLESEVPAQPRLLHRFEVPLELPHGSLMEDWRLVSSRLDTKQ